MFKKIISLLLATTLISSLLIPAFAEDDAKDEIATNLAIRKKVIANSTRNQASNTGMMNDGNLSTMWTCSETPPIPLWVIIDLERPTDFNRVILYIHRIAAASYKVQCSNDAKTWNDVFFGGTLPGGVKTIDFEKQTARFFRLYIDTLTNPNCSIKEIEIYNSSDADRKLTPFEEPSPYVSQKDAEMYRTKAVQKLRANITLGVNSPIAYVYGKVEYIDLDNPMIMPVELNKKIYVPLKFISKVLGAHFSLNERNETLSLFYLGNSYSFKTGDKVYLLNGKEKNIKNPFELVNNNTLVSLEVVETVYGKKILWDSKTKLIILTSKNNLFSTDEIQRNNELNGVLEVFRLTNSEIAKVDILHDNLKCIIGEPAVLKLNQKYADMSIATNYNCKVNAKLDYEDGSVIKYYDYLTLKAGDKRKFVFDGRTTKVGTYKITLDVNIGGKSYPYTRYFSVVDDKKIKDNMSLHAYLDEDIGKLRYTPDFMGNRIMDFSTAGYKGGGVPIPKIETKITIEPGYGDDSLIIQAAIDELSKMPLDENGFRGAILMKAGRYNCETPINIFSSGIVLRGEGEEPNYGTSLRFKKDANLNIGDKDGIEYGEGADIEGTYLPSGVDTVTVTDSSIFKVGDTVALTRVSTAKWINQVGMDQLYRNGNKQTWINVDSVRNNHRVITKIEGNTLTLNAAVADSYDGAISGYPIGRVKKTTYDRLISNVGVEKFNLYYVEKKETEKHSLLINNTEDFWVSDFSSNDGRNTFAATLSTRRGTISNYVIRHSVKSLEAAAPADFNVSGTQILFVKCKSSIANGMWSFTTGYGGSGPIVVYDSFGGMAPHQRWTTGILMDNCYYPVTTAGQPGVAYTSRGTMGSGHGWTTGWSVAWNMDTPNRRICAAPGTMNWSIGGLGEKLSSPDPDGIYDLLGKIVTPDSLYLQQLKDRTGSEIIK